MIAKIRKSYDEQIKKLEITKVKWKVEQKKKEKE